MFIIIIHLHIVRMTGGGGRIDVRRINCGFCVFVYAAERTPMKRNYVN